jgi:hypothetical protein
MLRLQLCLFLPKPRRVAALGKQAAKRKGSSGGSESRASLETQGKIVGKTVGPGSPAESQSVLHEHVYLGLDAPLVISVLQRNKNSNNFLGIVHLKRSEVSRSSCHAEGKLAHYPGHRRSPPRTSDERFGSPF